MFSCFLVFSLSFHSLFCRNLIAKSKSHSSIVAPPPPGGIAIGIGPQLPPLTGGFIKLRHVETTSEQQQQQQQRPDEQKEFSSATQHSKANELGKAVKEEGDKNKYTQEQQEEIKQPTALPAFLQGGLRRSQTQVSFFVWGE